MLNNVLRDIAICARRILPDSPLLCKLFYQKRVKRNTNYTFSIDFIGFMLAKAQNFFIIRASSPRAHHDHLFHIRPEQQYVE